jgi:hypothetical protein
VRRLSPADAEIAMRLRERPVVAISASHATSCLLASRALSPPRRRHTCPADPTWKVFILHPTPTRYGRALSRLTPALALVALVAFATTATAKPPTSAATAASFDTVTLPLTGRVTDVVRPSPAATSEATVGEDTRLADPGTAPTATRAPRKQPAAKAGVFVKPAPKPKVYSAAGTSHVLRGRASWYCNKDASRAQLSACHYQYPDTGAYNAYAAAGPKLRAALGANWRGKVVLVDGLRVKLVDWCECHGGESGVEKLIDLYYDVYLRTGSSVTIRW